MKNSSALKFYFVFKKLKRGVLIVARRALRLLLLRL